MPKPRTAAGYDRAHVARVKGACLYLATKIGDLLDELIIVGGLVPSLLVDQTKDGVERHVGTNDLDVGMEIAILDGKRYAALTERLRSAGFGPDENERGHPTRQRWKIDGPPTVTLDFLIPPSRAEDKAGQLRDIEATSPQSSRQGCDWRSRTGSRSRSREERSATRKRVARSGFAKQVPSLR